MQYSQKYTLVAFLQYIDTGTEFDMAEWPVHITLADVFAIELNDDVIQNLADFLVACPAIDVSASDDAVLGTTNVTLIEKSDRLQRIHDQIVDLLELNGAKFNTSEFTRSGFLPHVTIQESGKLRKGDKIEISTVSLIDMFPSENWQQRKVVSNFKFSKLKL